VNNLETLTKARSLLSDPEHWTRGFYAKTKDGMHTMPDDASAFCFCLRGAVHHVLGVDITSIRAIRVCCLIEEAFVGHPISEDSEFSFVEWQDRPRRKHSEVIRLLDKAIGIAASHDPLKPTG
jgi:hypothetical protein